MDFSVLEFVRNGDIVVFSITPSQCQVQCRGYSATAQHRAWLGLAAVAAWRQHDFTLNKCWVKTGGTFGESLQT
jgi:hypothetical protein